MRSLRPILLTLLITLCGQHSFSQTTDETAQSIKRFYTFYMIQQEGIQDEKKMNDTLDHYCTADFLNRIRNDKELEADPMLNVQDFDKKWVNTLTITKVSGKTNMYKVCIFDSYSKENHCVTVFLKKEAELWKIDNVL